jgi:hypothetical protein
MRYVDSVALSKKKKWHFYGQSKKVRGGTFKFLVLTALSTRIVSAHIFALPFSMKRISAYLIRDKYIKFNAQIIKQRI